MSLNTSHAGKDGVLLFNTERILIFYDGVKLDFDDINDEHFKGKKGGRIYLTTHRVIFVNTSKKDKLQSLSMPFHTMKSLDLEQPVFGANYISGKVLAEQNGGWTGSAKFKMYFNKGGAIEFGKAMMMAGKLASQNARSQPPPYTNPGNLPYYQAPPPAYNTPSGGMYGFVPITVFPDSPPPGTVFMFNNPPPYPGMDSGLAPYPFVNPSSPNNPVPFNAPQVGGGASGGAPPAYQPAGYTEYTGPSNPNGPPYNNNSAFQGQSNNPAYPANPPGYSGASSGPTQPRYPPASGYNPQQQPFNPQQQPYNPQQQPFNPQQQPYNPQQQPFNPQQQPFNPQQPPFNPQQPYNPHQSPFNPQQPYNPHQPPFQNGHAQPSAPTAAAAKEAEAMGGTGAGGAAAYGGQAYFDPNNPQNVYMPPYPGMQPPVYQPTDKKND